MIIFLNNIKTELSANWNIEQVMNAHISPDGLKIVFMGYNSGLTEDWDVYIWNIGSTSHPTNLTNCNNIRDEDPKFSPDGNSIIFKQEGDIKVMNLSGNIINTLTNDEYTIEESMPYFTKDGQKVIYARDDREKSDIYMMNINGTGITSLYSEVGVSEYYPIIKDSSSFFYSRWISSSIDNDQIYLGDFSGNTRSLSINDIHSDNSDAYPVNSDYLFFSSNRSGGFGGYDIYLGKISTGEVWNLNNFGVNSSKEELGVCYFSSSN